MEELQNELVSEENATSETDKCTFENDLLQRGIVMMTKEHEIEKNYIIKAKDKTIEELKNTNDELITGIGDQAYKMQQMDKASLGKDKKIESLTKRADELLEQKIKLEIDLREAKKVHKQSSVKHTQQDARIKKLESELSEVKQQLEAMKEDQVKLIATYLTKAEEKQEKRDNEAAEKQERRDEEMRKMIQRNHEEMLFQMKLMSIKSKSSAVKDSTLSISDAHNVQISLDNGRNIAAFHRRTGVNNRKLSKGNNNLPK
jgi:DNA repair exonuclease SbcCD ATPase subunit